MDRDDLIVRHMAWARNQAGRYRGRGVSDEDLEAEAYLGLCDAALDYDPERFPDVSFASYAIKRVKRHLAEAIERASVLRMSRRLERAAAKCRQAEAALFAAGDARPTPEAIAAWTGLDAETVREALSISPSATSIESFGVMPSIVDPDQERLLATVEEVLDRCTELGRQVLTLCRVEELSIHQAARRLGRPLGEVRRAHDAACVTVADEMRRRGWTEQSWYAAIA